MKRKYLIFIAMVFIIFSGSMIYMANMILWLVRANNEMQEQLGYVMVSTMVQQQQIESLDATVSAMTLMPEYNLPIE